MPTKISDPHPPRGLTRGLLRLPNWLFRLHLGWLLFGHFLQVTHTGRRSGLPRRTVLEVLCHDRASDAYMVMAGFGPRSDWVRNIEQTPRVEIAVGLRRLAASAAVLGSDEAAAAILDYTRRFPFARGIIARVMGYRTDGSDADFRALARLATVVAFCPLASGTMTSAAREEPAGRAASAV